MDRIREPPLTNSNLREYISQIQCIKEKSIFLSPSELPKRIVAIGDIHGDLEGLFSILLNSNIIDITGRWIAIDTYLVQTGDIFDKGRKKPPLLGVGLAQTSPMHLLRSVVPYDVIDKYGNAHTINNMTSNINLEFGEVGDELVILKFLTDLHLQACLSPDSKTKFGNSKVLLCSGNHEFMNTSQSDYFSDTPEEEVKRIIREGTSVEVQTEITKRRIKNDRGDPFNIPAHISIDEQRRILSGYVGINNITNQEYAHPMDAVLFGGPDYSLRKEIFKHGHGELAKKLGCILNAVVVIGDFIFSHGGINSINLSQINDITELEKVNYILSDYLLGNPTNPDEIEHYFVNPNNSILWYRELGKENQPDIKVCRKTIDLLKDQLHRPNLNIVIGHDIQGACIDPKADADRTISRVRNTWNRVNSDGTIDKCISLPTMWCNNQIYRIDTGISRMNHAPDYRIPNEGRLNSLIIDLNPDGTKKSVLAMNGIMGLVSPIKKD